MLSDWELDEIVTVVHNRFPENHDPLDGDEVDQITEKLNEHYGNT